VEAVVLKDEVLRLTDIPLIVRLPGMPAVARGAQVKLDILRWDEVDLTIEARLLEIPVADTSNAAAELDFEDEVEDAPEESVDAPEVVVEAAAEQPAAE
jgi:exoribonuclease-2